MSLFSFNKKSFDIITIGDVVVDAFIRLKDAHVNCDKDHGTCELCMTYADKIPYEFVEVIPAVGNSANAAVACARLGLATSFVAQIGDDSDGIDCLNRLEDEKVSTEHITTHKGQKTNYHYVLWFEMDRTILVKHEEYDYRLPDLGDPKWLYLSSLGSSTANYHIEIANYLEVHPDIRLAFQPGTFQMKLGLEKLGRIYKRTDILFLNVEEAKRVLVTEEKDIKILLAKLRELGPKIAVITDGPNGSYADDGERQFYLTAYPDQKPAYERTGAGDAFASTTTAMIIKGKSLEQAMKYGSINSMSVVGEVGAQKGLLTPDRLETLLAKAPSEWNIKLL